MREVVKEAGEQITLIKHRTSNPKCTKGHLEKNDRVNEIISHLGCDGITIYYRENNDGFQELALKDVYSRGNVTKRGSIVYRFVLCSSYCGTSNSLNG